MKYITEARMAVAAAWVEHPNKVMDPDIAEFVSRLVAGWMGTAAMFARNADFYRGLLEECARHLGKSVRTCDDGSLSEDPLMLKIPEAVREAVMEAKSFGG